MHNELLGCKRCASAGINQCMSFMQSGQELIRGHAGSSSPGGMAANDQVK